ncbi:MAG: prephenate dehydratase [Bacteroidales bacterium]
MENKIRQPIAIQGIKGSFHHEAACRFFGEDAGTEPCQSFKSLVESVASNRAAYGVMAVENSLVGGMLPNFSMIREANLHVVGEVTMRIAQHLLSLQEASIGHLREVHSHPMAIMQCEDFFLRHPGIRLVESSDTALSAQIIARDRLYATGAIGSTQAATIYGLKVLAANIETNKENFTRFWVLARTPLSVENGVAVKASLAFVTSHRPGSLVEVLQPLAEAGVNLSMLQSLPMVGRSWEYIFHADMIFPDAAMAKQTIQNLSARLDRLWLMGIYPSDRASSFQKNHSILREIIE